LTYSRLNLIWSCIKWCNVGITFLFVLYR
jgi:hypothetical protein